MTPIKWFLFMAGAGAVVGLALLFEDRIAGGTVGTEQPILIRPPVRPGIS